WRNAVSLSVVLGCALTLLHASFDFVFQNPAVLLTWSVLLVGAVRWAELDQPGGRRLAPASLRAEPGRRARAATAVVPFTQSPDGPGPADDVVEPRSTRDEF
ncbi:MAG: hypothetical protein ABSE59_06340, partial [Opitutaceae bacterium]